MRARRAPAAARLLALLLLVCFASCSDLRVRSGVYNTVEDARRAGAIDKGWVPDGLPASTADLREGHLPDGRHWGVFAFAPDGQPAVRALLGAEITTGTLPCDPPGRLEFWPRLLQSPVDVARVRSTGFRLYHGAGGRTYAINWGQGRAYYWK